MKHFGDITKLSGYTLPVVDIITGGSPCQDLSVAGKRAGLDGERSGLFMEQIRIVKEMRDRDRRTGRTGWLIRPRFMVWENVPGAFSSNKGKDFQAVLSEIVKIAEPDAPDVPLPEGGRWSKSGCLYSDLGNWSVAWRVHDAQFWGVPQRRKRIALVADFGGLTAPEILFEREGLSGYSEPGETAGEGAAASAEGSVGAASGVKILNQFDFQGNQIADSDGAYPTLRGCGGAGYQQGYCFDRRTEPILLESNQNHATIQTDGISTALPASAGMGGGYVPMVVEKTEPIPIHDQATRFKGKHGEKTDGKGNGLGVGCPGDPMPTLSAGDCHAVYSAGFSFGQSANARSLGYQEEISPTLRGGEGGNQKPCVFDARGNGDGEIAPTMTGDHQNRVTDYTALCVGNGQLNQMSMLEQANTLDTMHDQQAVMIAAVDCRNGTENTQINGTLQAKSTGGIGVNFQNVCRVEQTVRRLTPLECERLQGYPDGWTDIGEWTDSKGKKHKGADSPRYKALGNSIALPFWAWMARRICAQYERPMTMGSLFDGIGGFPLVFERAGAKAVWASEIEEFPIAVTKKHFPEEVTNENHRR